MRALAPLSLALLVSASPRPARDLQELGRSLKDYFEARAAGRDVEAPRAAVAASLERVAEEERLATPLASPLLLSRAMRSVLELEDLRAERGRVEEARLEEGSFATRGLDLAYRLPREYDPGRDWPLVLAVPDAGERPKDHLLAAWSGAGVRDGAIVLALAMPADEEAWTKVMVAGEPGGLAHVLTALRFARERFAVDPDRVFVAGLGAGVAAAIAAGSTSPERFAGVVGRSGELGATGPENFGNLPTLFTGECEGAGAFAGEAESSALRADLEEDDGTAAEEAAWSWMLAHPRTPFPKRVRLVTGQPFPTRAYWLRVSPSAPGGNATAELDRAKNEVVITSEGVSHVTLYLNDELLDLGRPVQLEIDGRKREVRLERSLSTTLDLFDAGTSDAGCVYVARAVFPTGEAAAAAVEATAPAVDRELEQRLTAAGSSPEALREVHAWCAAQGRTNGAAVALRRLLRYAPDDAAAREALGYHGEPGQWLPTEAAWRRWKESQEEASAAARGLVLHRGVWMHPDERSLANKGRVKDAASGLWFDREERERLSEGWVRQDLAWIPPEDAPQVDRGLFRVDGEWVDLATANQRHARIESMWRIPCGEVLLFTTVERAVALRAAEHMARALPDLRRVFGVEPALPLPVALMRDEEQYDRLAFGDPDGRRLPGHAGRLHVVTSGFFAESWFAREDGERVFRGMGVGLWDTNVPYGDLYGVHSARLAVGLSFVDAIDPSPKAVRRALSKGTSPAYHEEYREEKRLPAWLRRGGAVYAERYFEDRFATGDTDPFWARAWSLENLARLGGLRPLAEVFRFDVRPEDRDDGQRLFLEAGLLVAFLLDGGCEPATAALRELQDALRAGRLRPSHVTAIEEALVANEAALRTFAGG